MYGTQMRSIPSNILIICNKKCFVNNNKIKGFQKNAIKIKLIPFLLAGSGAAKILDCMRFFTLRGVCWLSPPKMSLLPPPGGFRTLKRNKKKHTND